MLVVLWTFLCAGDAGQDVLSLPWVNVWVTLGSLVHEDCPQDTPQQTHSAGHVEHRRPAPWGQVNHNGQFGAQS